MIAAELPRLPYLILQNPPGPVQLLRRTDTADR